MPSSGLLNRKENNWEEIRSRGFWRFVLFYGVLSWGLISGFIYFLITTFLQPGTPLLKNLILSLAIFSVAGVFWGMTMWYIREKKFREN